MSSTERMEDVKSIGQLAEHITSGSLPITAAWPWYRDDAPGEWTTRTITMAEVIDAIDEYVERKEQGQ